MIGCALAEAGKLDTAVDGHGRRAGAPFCAKKYQGGRSRARSVSGLAPRRRPADCPVKRLVRWRPGKELVRASTHRLKNQLGIGGLGDGENARLPVRGMQPLNRGHSARLVGSDIDDDEVGRRPLAHLTIAQNADRNRAGAQELTNLLPERFVFRDDEANKLRHDY